MERTDKLNQLKQFNRPWEYDCCDIAEKLDFNYVAEVSIGEILVKEDEF